MTETDSPKQMNAESLVAALADLATLRERLWDTAAFEYRAGLLSGTDMQRLRYVLKVGAHSKARSTALLAEVRQAEDLLEEFTSRLQAHTSKRSEPGVA